MSTCENNQQWGVNNYLYAQNNKTVLKTVIILHIDYILLQNVQDSKMTHLHKTKFGQGLIYAFMSSVVNSTTV